MKGINGYTKQTPTGVEVDVDNMLADLITVYKAGGLTQEHLVQEVNRLWQEVKVGVSIPDRAKH